MSDEISVPSKPTKLLVEKNANDELVKGRVEDATLLYVNLQEGELAFNSETDRNLSVQMAVTKDTARNWKSVFPKNGYREVPNEQFVKSYKTEPPYPEQEDQYVLKLKSRGTYQHDDPEKNIQAGDVVAYDSPSRPKLYEIVEGKPVDVTMATQPANGSKGTVAFRTATNKFGTFPVLSGVLVTELIESQQQASLASDFGITEETPSTQRIAVESPSESNGAESNAPESTSQSEESQPSGFEDPDWL